MSKINENLATDIGKMCGDRDRDLIRRWRHRRIRHDAERGVNWSRLGIDWRLFGGADL